MSMTISLEEFPGRSREQRTSRRQQASKGKSAASLDRQRSKRRDNPNPNPSGAIATYLPKEIGEQQVDLGGEEEEVEVEVYVASGAAGEEEKEEVGGGLEEPKALDDGDDRKEKEEEVAASMQLLQRSQRDYAPLIYSREHMEAKDLDLDEPWSSSHRFYCFGLCVRGPKSKEIPVDLCLVVSAIFTFVLVVASGLGFGLLRSGLGLTIMCVLWVVVAFSGWIITSLTEPGVIVGQTKTELLRQLEDMDASPAQIGSNQEMKICKECNLVTRQDQFVMHCYECDACVEDLDHHCGVTGTCIGARNKVHFFMMLYLISGAWTYLLAGLVMIVVQTFVGDAPETLQNLQVANLVLATISAIHLACYLLFWAGAYFDWIRVSACCGGFVPNPIYYVHKQCCRAHYRRRPHSKWVTNAARTACCCLPCFRYPTRRMYKRHQPVSTAEGPNNA